MGMWSDKHEAIMDKTHLYEYHRTKSDAECVAKELRAKGIRCAVLNLTGSRSRRSAYDAPWQVRTYKPEATNAK